MLHADPFSAPPLRTRAERRACGKKLRQTLTRSGQGDLTLDPARRPDVLKLLRQDARGCLPGLVPLRFGRIAASPFAFFRGSASLMAADLAQLPNTGERVQACGDAHLANFGAFATGERQLVFDLNDFDETLAAPWEWDVKRLCASIVLAAREVGHSEGDAAFAARSAARAYRLRLREYARWPSLDLWADYIGAEEALDDMAADVRRLGQEMFSKARTRTHLDTLDKLAVKTEGGWKLREDPPLLVHAEGEEHAWLREVQGGYLSSVSPDCRQLLSRYRLADWALKVTGVGSCGRRSLVLLLRGGGKHDALFLQVKEARPSVLEAHLGPAAVRSPAHRVVRGQQLIQAARDPFLGWATKGEHSFYVRQLRDMKGRFDLDAIRPRTLEEVSELCGWALARAHARTGDAAVLAAYLGGSEKFDKALGRFAVAYADQAEQDYAVLDRAVRRGEVEVEREENR